MTMTPASTLVTLLMGLGGDQSRWAWTEPCKSCEWGVRELQDAISDPDVESRLAHAIDLTVCDNLPAADHTPCATRVHDYIARAVEAFEDYGSPRTLCRPLCPNKKALTVHSHDTQLENNSWKCPFCEFAATQAEAALKDKKTDKEILDWIRDQCSHLPQMFANPCISYVETDGPIILQMLETMPPEQVCEELHACEKHPPETLAAALATHPMPGRLALDVAALLQRLGAVHKARQCSTPSLRGLVLNGAPEPTQECRFCKIAVMEAREKVADPEFQSQVMHFAESLCTHAGEYADTCRDEIQQYAPLAFSLALDYLRPHTICADIAHICPREPDQVAVAVAA